MGILNNMLKEVSEQNKKQAEYTDKLLKKERADIVADLKWLKKRVNMWKGYPNLHKYIEHYIDFIISKYK